VVLLLSVLLLLEVELDQIDVNSRVEDLRFLAFEKSV